MLTGIQLPTSLSINDSTVGQFSLLGPFYGKTLSNVMHYPFPISTHLAHYPDVKMCEWSDFVQEDGMRFLKDTDFGYVNDGYVVPVGEHYEPTAGPDGEEVVATELLEIEAEYNDAETTTASPWSSLSTVYSQFLAYNESRVQDVFVTNRKMKRLPFTQSIQFLTSNLMPKLVILKVVVTNRNGVVLSVLHKDVDLSPLLLDTSRPQAAPEIEASLIQIGNAVPGLGINVTQRDVMASA